MFCQGKILFSMFYSLFSIRITHCVMCSIRPERKLPMLLSFPPATEMFHFAGCAPSYKGTCRKQVSFLIRTSRDITIIWHLPHAYRSHITSFIAL